MDITYIFSGVDLLLLISAYTLGCLHVSYFLVKASQGKDLRKLGSGNLGARNTGRFLGSFGFIAVLIFDIGKGMLAVLFVSILSENINTIYLSVIFVVLGHIWPIFLNFRGGRGVATSLGAFIVIEPLILLILGALIGIFYIFLRRTIICGLYSYLFLPFLFFLLNYNDNNNVTLHISISLCSLIILFSHRAYLKAEYSTLMEKANEEK